MTNEKTNIQQHEIRNNKEAKILYYIIHRCNNNKIIIYTAHSTTN